MKYYHDKQNKKIVFSQPLKKCQNGLKVLFYRNVDEREKSDYPVAVADIKKGQTEFDWFDNFLIFNVLIKRKRFFGLFGSKWEVVEEYGSK